MISLDDFDTLEYLTRVHLKDVKRNLVCGKSVECAGILHPGSNGSRFAVDLECGGVVPLEWRHRKVKVLMVLDE